MPTPDLQQRFAYHPPKDAGIADDHQLVRKNLHVVAGEIDRLCPDSREKSLALTKLEEAMFWANAAIARVKNYQDS